MCSDVAIKVSGVSKCFHIYDKPRDRLLQMLTPDTKKYYREFWALKSVSFDIKRGTTVGIVGRNGSGKSTILQLICGTLSQSEGEIKTVGRIAALLELGSGFNPEFTGRENVYMNSAVLGLTKNEVDQRFQEIVDFAGIGLFIDQPVKTYSSGMLVRLAFAVAINVDPEILIVDEALSVGDELFQRKCFARIEEIKNKGATILFVSHSGTTIVELCDSAILLDSGEMLAMGSPKEIVANYQKLLYAPADKREEICGEIRQSAAAGEKSEATASSTTEPVARSEEDQLEFFDPHLKSISTIEFESHGAYISNPHITNGVSQIVNNLHRGRVYRYSFDVRFDSRATGVRFGMVVRTTTGFSLGGAHSSSMKSSIAEVEQGSTLNVTFDFTCSLNPGTYFLNAGVFGCVDSSGEETVLHRLVDAFVFRVSPFQDNLATEIIDFGCVSGVAKI
ncbi:ABC transporter ATP-binding protein [Pseudomonas atacamensis]|jgi:lipopolysaccharide transport system ATP-binding protein|uniref:ABC transporter ATP-binding protein n=1 Tax=Pseudomonas atacamensis TaxID=2565368 RepID=UPI003209A116